jgi:hypothetical protein
MDVVQLCVQLLHGGFHIERDQSQEDKDSIQKSGLGYTVMKKLLEIGGYLNKGYHVFEGDYFISVPLDRHLDQLSTYITGTVGRNRRLLPQQFKNKFSVGQKMYYRSSPLLVCVSCKKKSQKKSSHSSLHPRHSRRRGGTGDDTVAIHK